MWDEQSGSIDVAHAVVSTEPLRRILCAELGGPFSIDLDQAWLRRWTKRFLLLVSVLGLLAFLAGAALVALVDPATGALTRDPEFEDILSKVFGDDTQPSLFFQPGYVVSYTVTEYPIVRAGDTGVRVVMKLGAAVSEDTVIPIPEPR